MPNVLLIALVALLPLASFVLLGLSGKKVFRQSGGIISTVLMLTSFILALYIGYEYFFASGKIHGSYVRQVVFRYTWLEFSPGMSIDMGLMLDPLSVLMIIIVSFVSLMVHIYSLAYMRGEERFSIYYAFLSLFSFSMLGLVLSSNIFQVYFFWELVGVSSFLLIGFYYDRPSAVAASKKAFIVTRFADLGFLIGILILSFYAGTLDFNTLIQRLTQPGSVQFQSALGASFLGFSALSWGLILVFIGGAGKSAMFPLHIWLPDAMEGPTPVSALIHAATMVVAGVFLVARLFPIYAAAAPAVLNVVACVGILSALIAALVACTQTDIKRVLAYSTMSQIGFMMFALGLGAKGEGLGFTAALFHLFTHALFKALLFLGAGVVIHLVHSNEMKDMGGLRKYLPVTHICFLLACLAISGIPPFSGFFSKEEILLASYRYNRLIYWTALFTSGLTAFYMFRLYFRIFWQGPASENLQAHHGGSIAFAIPLVILATGAALGGLVPFPDFVSSTGAPVHAEPGWQFSILPVAVALTGILLATWLYKKQNDRARSIAARIHALYQMAYRKFYIDEVYLFLTKRIIFNLIGRPAAWFDRHVVDGLVNATGNTTQWMSERVKNMQSGKVQQYAIYFLTGVLLIAALFIYLWKP